MKQRLLFFFLGFFLISGCKIDHKSLNVQAKETEQVSMPDAAFSRLRIQATGPVNIKFLDNESVTTEPYAIIEKSVTTNSTGYKEEEIAGFMQQAFDGFDDSLQLSFSIADDTCTAWVTFVPELNSLSNEHTMFKYFYLYPAVTLVLVNVSDLAIEARTEGKIKAEEELSGAVLESTQDTITFSSLKQSSITGSSISGESIDNSTLAATNTVKMGSVADTSITSAKTVTAEILKRTTIRSGDVTADAVDNATIVSTGKVAIGKAGGRLAVKTSGGSIAVDEFDGTWFNLRQITNKSANSSAGTIRMNVASAGAFDGIIKTDSGDINIDLLDTLSCIVELKATQGSIDIKGVEYYQINDDDPDHYAKFNLNAGDGSLTVVTDTGDIDVEVSDMFFPY